MGANAAGGNQRGRRFHDHRLQMAPFQQLFEIFSAILTLPAHQSPPWPLHLLDEDERSLDLCPPATALRRPWFVMSGTFPLCVQSFRLCLTFSPNIITHTLPSLSSQITHQFRWKSLLILPSNYIPNPAISHNHHCYRFNRDTIISQLGK